MKFNSKSVLFNFFVLVSTIFSISGMQQPPAGWPGHAQQQPPLGNFTIVTANVLYEDWYVRNVEKGRKMDIFTRINYFKDALGHQAALGGADILCFQEWPYAAGRKSAEQSQGFFKALTAVYPFERYEFIRDPKRLPHDGVLMLVNKQKFKVLKERFIDLGNKRIIIAELQANKSRVKVGVVNAHIPWKGKLQSQHYQTIIKNMSREINHWIICGDFNYDIWDSNTASFDEGRYNALKEIFARSLSVNSNVEWMAVPQATSFSNGFQFNDYLFYTTNLKPTAMSIVPQPGDYIKHTNPWRQADWFTVHFSDHAIVRATFEIPGSIAKPSPTPRPFPGPKPTPRPTGPTVPAESIGPREVQIIPVAWDKRQWLLLAHHGRQQRTTFWNSFNITRRPGTTPWGPVRDVLSTIGLKSIDLQNTPFADIFILRTPVRVYFPVVKFKGRKQLNRKFSGDFTWLNITQIENNATVNGRGIQRGFANTVKKWWFKIQPQLETLRKGK